MKNTLADHGHVLITGGSSGIGLEVARLFVARQWRVSLLARDPEKLAAACQQLDAHGTVTGISADVADEQGVSQACELLISTQGVPDVVVLSAGIAVPGYFADLDSAVFQQSMQVNYFGSLWVARSLLPAMAERGSGSLVFVASAAGLVGVFGYTAYGASKFAVRGLAESLRAEYIARGVHIGIVYPPDTDTPQLAAENLVKPVETRAIGESGSLWQAADVAAVILRGIQRKRFMMTPGLDISLLARLHSLVLPALNWWFDRLARKAARPMDSSK